MNNYMYCIFLRQVCIDLEKAIEICLERKIVVLIAKKITTKYCVRFTLTFTTGK